MVADRWWGAAARCEVLTPSPALPTRGREIHIAGLATRGRQIHITGLPTRGRQNIATRGREVCTPSPTLPTRGRGIIHPRGRESREERPGGLFAGAADRATGLDSRNRGPTGGDQRLDASLRAGFRAAAADG